MFNSFVLISYKDFANYLSITEFLSSYFIISFYGKTFNNNVSWFDYFWSLEV